MIIDTTQPRESCADCGKQLGGTTALCYDCGGDKPEPTKEERLLDAIRWKLTLGVEEKYIERAHDPEPNWAKI